jgi:hypothetical protein
MIQQSIRSEVISELQMGHLGLAMKLTEDNALQIDDELCNEAVKACMASLKQHFHWIIPAFVKTFGINGNARLKLLAGKIIALSLQHGQPLIADLAAKVFDIGLDENIKRIIETAKAKIVQSIKQADVIYVQPDSFEYNFELK